MRLQDLPKVQEETHIQICESKFGPFPLCLPSSQNHTGPLLFSLLKDLLHKRAQCLPCSTGPQDRISIQIPSYHGAGQLWDTFPAVCLRSPVPWWCMTSPSSLSTSHEVLPSKLRFSPLNSTKSWFSLKCREEHGRKTWRGWTRAPSSGWGLTANKSCSYLFPLWIIKRKKNT